MTDDMKRKRYDNYWLFIMLWREGVVLIENDMKCDQLTVYWLRRLLTIWPTIIDWRKKQMIWSDEDMTVIEVLAIMKSLLLVLDSNTFKCLLLWNVMIDNPLLWRGEKGHCLKVLPRRRQLKGERSTVKYYYDRPLMWEEIDLVMIIPMVKWWYTSWYIIESVWWLIWRPVSYDDEEKLI